MREIKFRAWNELTKEMLYPRQHHNAPKYFFTTSENINTSLIPLQFTGLKDKNGEEVYEGDIVKDTVNGGFGFIEYDAKHMKFAIRPGWFNPVYQMGYPKDREIIGNIHENPDLLK